MGTTEPPIELTVEREIPSSDPSRPTRVRLTVRLEPPPTGALPPGDLAARIGQLSSQLEDALRAAGIAPSAGRADRDLPELLGTYRPRQRELVELLHDERELTDGEYRRLLDHLGRTVPEPSAAPPPTQPILAAPLESPPTSSGSRPLPPARPVPELLATFQIDSLRQAGAVRARRQISFEEYMALKKHFSAPEAPASPPA
ncbi:MAG: hypothetical protein L3K03_00795 [Thermoplasmata archaeon]|nr:hypothetical protein [Thermoplasmata archaeon]